MTNFYSPKEAPERVQEPSDLRANQKLTVAACRSVSFRRKRCGETRSTGGVSLQRRAGTFTSPVAAPAGANHKPAPPRKYSSKKHFFRRKFVLWLSPSI